MPNTNYTSARAFPIPKFFPSLVRAQILELRQAAKRWVKEMVAAWEAVEQSAIRADLLDAGINPEDDAAVDKYFDETAVPAKTRVR